MWHIVSQGNTVDQEHLDFDIDQLPPAVARKLEMFVYSKVTLLPKKKKPQQEEFKRTDKTTPDTPPPHNASPHANEQNLAAKPDLGDSSSESSFLSNSDSDQSV